MAAAEPDVVIVGSGAGGGALQPLAQAILLESFPPAKRGMAMAIFGIGVMFGPIIGPVLGGLCSCADAGSEQR
jgi:MFS family permease